MITTEGVKEGGAQASPSTVKVEALKRFAYPVLIDGKWDTQWFEAGDKLDMDKRHFERHKSAGLVKGVAGRKKKEDKAHEPAETK